MVGKKKRQGDGGQQQPQSISRTASYLGDVAANVQHRQQPTHLLIHLNLTPRVIPPHLLHLLLLGELKDVVFFEDFVGEFGRSLVGGGDGVLELCERFERSERQRASKSSG